MKLFKEEVINLGIAINGVSIQGLLKSSENSRAIRYKRS